MEAKEADVGTYGGWGTVTSNNSAKESERVVEAHRRLIQSPWSCPTFVHNCSKWISGHYIDTIAIATISESCESSSHGQPLDTAETAQSCWWNWKTGLVETTLLPVRWKGKEIHNIRSLAFTARSTVRRRRERSISVMKLEDWLGSEDRFSS